jgi:hypothetical protein
MSYVGALEAAADVLQIKLAEVETPLNGVNPL